MKFGVIGGTGFYDFLGKEARQEEVQTRWGRALVQVGKIEGVEVCFVARHGTAHSVPPHRVNYRANIAALRKLGVQNVFASAAVGSMAEDLPPGSFAILTDFLDFTKARAVTFFDGEGGVLVHTDVSEPYCPHLREELQQAATALGEPLALKATYVCAEGPRFETPAEIRMFRQLGGDVVGMTGVPEAPLAREAGLCYASVAIITNWAAGVTAEPLKHEEVAGFMADQAPRLVKLFRTAILSHREAGCATCRGGRAHDLEG